MVSKLLTLRIFDFTNTLLKEVDLNRDLPLIENVENIVIYDDWEYRLEIEVNCKKLFIGDMQSYYIDTVSMFIGETIVPLEMIEKRECEGDIDLENYGNYIYTFSTAASRHFMNYYDLTNISVSFENQENEMILFYSPYLYIATNKQYSKNIERMLEEIFEMNDTLLESCFKNNTRSFMGIDIQQGNIKSVYSLMEFYKKVINSLKRLYPLFKSQSKTKIEQKEQLIDSRNVHSITDKEIIWLASNFHQLSEVKYKTNVSKNNRYFIPEKILSTVYENTMNIYENKIVLSFIIRLISSINNLYIDLKREISNISNNKIEVKGNYEIPSNVYKKIIVKKYTETLNLCRQLQEEYSRTYIMYKNLFKCDEERNFGRPKFTHVFRNIYHYRTIYDLLIQWWDDFRGYSLEQEKYLMRLKKLSKLYEYYCLLKIVTTLDKLGYKKVLFDHVNYSLDYESEDTELMNKYIFTSKTNDSTITLYYEPIIYHTPSKNTEFNLYKLNCTHLCPDFLIKYTHNDTNRTLYGIFDSKYSNLDNSKNRTKYILDTTFKYLHQIGSPTSMFTPILFLWLLYPSKYGLKKIEEQKVIPNTYVLPYIGSYSISPDVEENEIVKFFRDLLALFSEYIRKQ